MKLNDKKSWNGVFGALSFSPAWEASLPILSGSCPALAHVPSDLLLWSFSPRFLAPWTATRSSCQSWQLHSWFIELWASCIAVYSAGSLSQYTPSRASLWPLKVRVRSTQYIELFLPPSSLAILCIFRTLLKCYLLGAFADLPRKHSLSGFPKHFASTFVLIICFLLFKLFGV